VKFPLVIAPKYKQYWQFCLYGKYRKQVEKDLKRLGLDKAKSMPSMR
jgi:hypothetical protein